MENLVKAEIWTIARTDQGNAVLIRPIGSDIAVPIFIGQLETQSILIGFGDISIPRPLTHDLMISLLDRTGTELLRIEINELKEGTFYARLILSGSETPGSLEFALDARPSDALALAVRLKCPVLISEKVVAAAGVSVNLIVEASADQSWPESIDADIPKDQFSPEIPGLRNHRSLSDDLEKELEQAIGKEEYEKAAELRDRITELKRKKQDGKAGPGGYNP